MEYRQMLGTACRLARDFVPEGDRILVVSKGDGDLLAIEGRHASHFPQVDGGTYAGHHPGDGDEAIRHLEDLRGQGWEYLLFPATSRWWLSHYANFEAHLRTFYDRICDHESCAIYRLSRPAGPIADDWHRASDPTRRMSAHHPLATDRPESPATNGVARDVGAPRGRSEELAGSMDGYARVKLRHFLSGTARLRFERVDDPVVSIVIPTYRQSHYTLIGLESLLANPCQTPFEVIVVDNASDDDTEALLGRFDNIRVARNGHNLGFGEACNRGIGLARGEFVCLLNNDTLLTPGWLDELVGTIRSRPDCGGVGAKLIHPSGLLQEAGGIIWRDGSNHGYGRGSDPAEPEFEYVREVDYCSAACFLARKSLLRSLGGFDPRYSPAYYEDTDLCMAIREAGYRILYQPRACVFHFEFGSGKQARAIELQLKNREKFRVKWRRQLRLYPAVGHGEEWMARDRREGRRLLVADDRVPDPGQGSGFPRARSLLESLAALGYVVTFLPLNDASAPEPASSELRQLGVEILQGAKDIRSQLSRRPNLYDALIVSRPHNARWIRTFQEFNPEATVIYDAEAIFSLRDALQAEVQGDPLPRPEVSRRLREELDLAEAADAVITVSEPERALFARHHPDLRVYAWGASIEARDDPPAFDARFGYLFVGSLSTPPNADAVRLLLGSIFPAIRETSPDSELVVVGANPPRLPRDADATGSLHLAGYVADVGRYFDRARVFLAPHRFAAGSPYKVIQAMASGVPCVLSPLLAAQMEVVDGVEALVAGGVDDFPTIAVRLHEDRALWQRIQSNALQLVRDRYRPARMREILGECIEGSFGGRHGQAPCSCSRAVDRCSAGEECPGPSGNPVAFLRSLS